jgi:putative membrane protein
VAAAGRALTVRALIDEDEPVHPEDSARMRDLLASNRTLLAWVRTAISFAGLGFVVARFGLFLDAQQSLKTQAHMAPNTDLVRLSGYLGIFMVLVALLLTVIGYTQHRSTVRQEQPRPDSPQPSQWPAVVATASCALACALLALYLAITPT